jgi:uncharacterized protein YrrD
LKYDSELYDLPVVDRVNGQVVGYMRGVACRPGCSRIDGIVYEERNLLRRCRLVPWEAVSVIGEKSIVIDASAKNKPAKPVSCDGRENRVFNTQGSYMGRVSNYVIDEKSGAVLGMELSASVLDDLKFGRKIIENTGNIMKGENFLMMVGNDETVDSEQLERRSEDEGLC